MSYHPLTPSQRQSLKRGEASQDPATKYAALRRAMQLTEREFVKHPRNPCGDNHLACHDKRRIGEILYEQMSKRADEAHAAYEQSQWGESLDPVAIAIARIAHLL